MNNILTAIKSIVENSSIEVAENEHHTQNRANQMGDALEEYIRKAFAGCLGQDSRTVKRALSQTFSYIGNSKNPPDAMLKGCDAIEINKIKSLDTAKLQLNSSYPKIKLYSNNPKLCKNCQECEDWEQKDMLYVVGRVTDKTLFDIFFIYGDLYCDASDRKNN